MLRTAPVPIRALVSELIDQGASTWLIGSRVNPDGPRPPRDWDILAFGSREILVELSKRNPIPDLDLLVVYDGLNFKRPWRRADGQTNSGSLASWYWEQISDAEAKYRGTRLRLDGFVESRALKARRVFGQAA